MAGGRMDRTLMDGIGRQTMVSFPRRLSSCRPPPHERTQTTDVFVPVLVLVPDIPFRTAEPLIFTINVIFNTFYKIYVALTHYCTIDISLYKPTIEAIELSYHTSSKSIRTCGFCLWREFSHQHPIRAFTQATKIKTAPST